jgi:hypothetical protein
LSTLINGDTLHDTITIDKQSGTVVVLGTREKYLEKNIRLTLDVQAGSAQTPATSITANPTITMSDTGLVTATCSATSSVSPTVTAGYISSGSSGTVSVGGSSTYQIPVASVAETRAYLGIS